MTTPTLTCEHCESEIDVAKDPHCVIYEPTGHTDVMCEGCRERAWERFEEERMAGEGPPSFEEQQRAAYRIKRGWQA